MESIFQAILGALRRGERAALVSVIATSGSTPRGEGAKMAVFPAGDPVGTIGGGAVEYRCERIAREMLAGEQTVSHRFSLTPGDVSDLGMVCGGEVEVFFCCFDPADSQAEAFLQAACEACASREATWLIASVKDARVRMGLYDESRGLRFLSGIPEDALAPLLTRRPALSRDDGILYAEPVAREDVVYLFGGGHVSRALQSVLVPLSFHPVVFEDRPEFVSGGILGNFLRIGDSVTIAEGDYVVIMTRGHQSDVDVLAQALQTPATYIGMIGSRRKLEATFSKLRAEGFGDADFARLHSPIGLPIGAETPEEIAISIAAEMILHRARQTGV